ncbi:hypothetical protein BC2230_40091 [Burkholderia cepacia]
MITCFLRYVIDPYKLDQFETYGKMWIPLVEQFGGTHHGYFLPSEGANNIALAMFSFPSLAEYERSRTLDGRSGLPGRVPLRRGNALHRQLRAQLLPAGVRITGHGPAHRAPFPDRDEKKPRLHPRGGANPCQ